MANLEKVIYINEEDYSTLLNGGSITKGGTTYTYDSTALYVIKDVSAPEYAETAGYATSAGQATKATQDGSGNVITATYGKKPLVIEVDDVDTQVPQGTYNSITTALAAGRDVIVKITLTEDAGEIIICRINIDDSPENDYVFTVNIATQYYWCDIDSQDNFTYRYQTLADNLSPSFDITIANGDKLVVTDASSSPTHKIARASLTFDGSTTTQALSKKGTWETFYQKPSTGIPETDLASAVQTSLGKADTSVQKITSTDNAIARYDGTGGQIQNSGVTIDDSNHVTAAKFITSGGTSSQFVKGDGSLDSTAYAPKASPALTGTPTAPTATSGTNTTQIATTAFVQNALSNMGAGGSEMVDVTINGTTSAASFSANPYNAIKAVVDDGKIAVLNASVAPLSTTGVLIPVYEYTYSLSGSNYTGYKGSIQHGSYEISVDVQSTSSATVTITEVGTGVTVDSALSGTSTNPVQNKVIRNALQVKVGGIDTGNTQLISISDGLYSSWSDTAYLTPDAESAGDAEDMFTTVKVLATTDYVDNLVGNIETLLAAI